MKFTSKAIFITGLVGLFFSGAAILFNHHGLALKIMILVFLSLSLGATLYILESRKVINEK